jgi:UDP-glucose 4-epimerase
VSGFKGAKVLVVGGAGFVGGNLARRVLAEAPARLTIVDNLLSAEIENVPVAPVVDFRLGSIADDRLLEKLPVDSDYVFPPGDVSRQPVEHGGPDRRP